jgi:feruloyl-CoA synthase
MPTADVFTDPGNLAPRLAEKVDLGHGAFLLRSPQALAPYARCVGEWVDRWACETPDALAFAEPSPSIAGGWAALTWKALRHRIGRIAQGLLDLQLPHGRPVVVLSDNSLDHLALLLATMHVGRAACTVSSAYCRLAGSDLSRIHSILDALEPALIYAADSATYGQAAQAWRGDAVRVFSRGADAVPDALSFARLMARAETAAVQAAFETIAPETHAKYLLTSGSTGHPKVVINTHRMLCANQQMLAQTVRLFSRSRPVLLDWLPWSHTFGGNHNLNLVLARGGTMHLDDGRPVPGLVERTLAHLREVQPTVHFNVPRGYEAMLPALEADQALARSFFGRLQMLFYAGSGMPETTWRRLQAVAEKARAGLGLAPLWMTTSWGSTETAPASTLAHWRLDRPGVIGLPLPGVTLKFVPSAGKLELRVKGDHVFPGYRGNEGATRAAFDDEGFFCSGDAGHLDDTFDPNSGIVFDGRLAEDFKLTSGTWVSVGTLRLQVVAALAPLAQDAIITGHDRSETGVLVFLTEAARAMPAVQVAARVRDGLRALKAQAGGSSRAPSRALTLPDAPSIACGEITDKGYLNQRLALQRRAAEVERLHAEAPDAGVICV